MNLLGKIAVAIVTDLGKIAALIVAGVGALAVLFTVYAVYTSFSPHLLLNPLARDLMAASPNPEHPSSSLPVPLVPNHFQSGLGPTELDAAAGRVAFFFDSKNTDPPSRTYKAGGRHNFACGEEFVLKFVLQDGLVAEGVGYALWTCL
jgi:hypothetical protein